MFDAAGRLQTYYRTLRARGFEPDTVVAHPGWGDAAFIREVFPNCNYVAYLEYYYRSGNSDVDFNSEFPPPQTDLQYVYLRNATNLLAFAKSSSAITPTQWQASLFPEKIRNQLVVMHDGVDSQIAAPSPGSEFELPNGRILTSNDEVITYVARSLEPYRGFHIFMRALPRLLRSKPKAQVVIVGNTGVSYGRRPKDGTSWKSFLLNEVGSDLDLTRIHFLNAVPYKTFIQLMRVSSVHVYLTYPFVLSWSFLEAMSCECTILGSSTGPVLDVLKDGENGRLVNFFDHKRLAEIIEELLEDPAQRRRLGIAARQTILHNFDFRTKILPLYSELLEIK